MIIVIKIVFWHNS